MNQIEQCEEQLAAVEGFFKQMTQQSLHLQYLNFEEAAA